MATKTEYWTLFGDSGFVRICGKHGALENARREADRCELRGGAKHTIYKVQKMPRKRARKAS
jgi:hypothetical protein